MNNIFKKLVLLYFMSMTFIICGVGCTSEEGKNTVSTPPASELPEEASQEAGTPLGEAEPEPEKPAPPVEPPETEPASVSPETEKDDAISTESGPPAEFAIASDLWDIHTKGAPAFTHAKHSQVHKIECNECHHIYESAENLLGYEAGENIWREGMAVDKCGKCHDEPTIKNEKKLPPASQKKNLKLAFHNNCRGCHKGLKKENPETKAPVSCKQCHPPK